MSEKIVNFDELTPVNFLKRSALVYPDKTAVVYNDRRYTYKEFQDRVNRLASALSKAGVGQGDKVAFICPNTPPMLEAHFAVPMLGAALVTINIRLSPGEIAYIINHSDSKVFFVDNEFADLVKAIQDELTQVNLFVNICDINDETPLEGMDYETFLNTGSDQSVKYPIIHENEIISINYTSGTTGVPKGVMYSHRGAYLNALGEVVEYGLNPGTVYLWTLPMFHCNGWCFTWAVTAIGGTHVCLRKVVAEDIYRLIEAEKVSFMCAAPAVMITMTSYPGIEDVEIKHRLQVNTAGAPPAPTVIQNMEAIGIEVVHCYGLTEVYGPHSQCAWQSRWDNLSAEERAKLKARQGVPYVTSMYMDVVELDTMEPVPRDGKTMGEIVMRGNNVMLGYYKDSEATAQAFRGGWFHSGDLAVMHPDNYVQIMDRKKDIIISGGENISTVEIENVIYQHPKVLSAAVVAIPDPKWGEVPKAFVEIKPGADVTSEEIINFCKTKIARFKAPKFVEFIELPKTSTGKIQKFKLREKEWKGRDRRVA
jgi:fatty-acyl-CoA synthase